MKIVVYGAGSLESGQMPEIDTYNAIFTKWGTNMASILR